jgi:hypothetical protein
MRDLVGLEAADARDGEGVAVSAGAAVRKQRAVEAARRRRCCTHVDGREAKWAGAPTHRRDLRAPRGVRAAAAAAHYTAAGVRVDDRVHGDGGGGVQGADPPLPPNLEAACSTVPRAECMTSWVAL